MADRYYRPDLVPLVPDARGPGHLVRTRQNRQVLFRQNGVVVFWREFGEVGGMLALALKCFQGGRVPCPFGREGRWALVLDMTREL
jgi:hypothetical protein